MVSNSATPRTRESLPHKWQFSLRVVLLLMLGLSVVLAVVSQFPRQSAFAASMTFLLLAPLVVTAALRGPLCRWQTIVGNRGAELTRFENRLVRPLRWPGLWQNDVPPRVGEGIVTAAISTLLLVGSWPLLRAAGFELSMLSRQPITGYTYTRMDAARSMANVFFSPEYWLRLWEWELWSLARWWILFGVIALAWIVAAYPFRCRLKNDSAANTFARLLTLAPWLTFLEVAFLIGVWIRRPNVVPEPSTGFVVSIFSWHLWHWDCWLNGGWLIRGTIPTWIAGSIFFACVLRWRWWMAIIAAVFLVPIALLLSVASTVAYQHGFPPLF